VRNHWLAGAPNHTPRTGQDGLVPAASSAPTRPESLALPPAVDVVLIVIALSGVASSGPLIAATAAPALAIAFWRNALGAVATGVVTLPRRVHELRELDGRGWVVAAVAGVFLALHFGTWIPSLSMTSVAASTALVASQPVFAAGIARVRGQAIPGRAWIGIGIAMAAILLITGVDVSVSGRALAGDLLALAGGAFAAVYISVGSSARMRMSAQLYTTICYATCAVVLLVASLVGGQHLIGFSFDAWRKIVVITIVAQLLGHSLFNVVLRSTSPTVISLALLFEVPGAALIAYLWLHQHPGASVWVGVVVLISGLAVVVSARGRSAQDVPGVETAI
jgi:drug/metabolite transporter (DMT)-like permease